MATLAVLNTLVTANTNAFVKNMGKTSGVITSVGASMTKMIGIASGIGAVLIGFNSLKGAVDRVSASMKAIDETAKSAESLGLSTEALSSMQHAASLAGASNEELANGFKFMAKNITEAVMGSDSLNDAFSALNLEATTLAGMSSEDAFKTIADAISQVENPMQRAALSMEIFGKSGNTLLPLLNSGAAGISKMQAEAVKLGVAFNDIDAAQVEAANDAMTRVNAVVEGVSRQLAINLAPYIEAASMKFVELAGSGGGMGNIITNAIEMVAVGIAQASRVVDLFSGAWYAVKTAVLGTVTAILEGMRRVGETIENIASYLGQDVDLTSGLEAAVNVFAEDTLAAADKTAQAFSDMWTGARVQGVRDFFADIKSNALDAAKTIADTRENLRTIGEVAMPEIEFDFEKVAKQIGGMILDVTGSAAGAVADKIRNEAAGSASAILADSAEARSITFNARNTRNDKQNEIAANTKRTADGQREVVAAIDRAFGNVAVLSL